MNNELYPVKLMQLQKAAGELRALYSLWYESTSNYGGATYSEIKPMIEAFITKLSDYCG